jgi:broad specificity phosphatase PhoE
VIILVRHGRTDVNARGLLLGRLDPPLDATGERQAKAVAAALSSLRDPRVVTSPLRRAVQTAEAVAAGLAVAPTVDDRWIELDYGDWDGLPLAEVPESTWRAWRDDLALRPPGGETLRELAARVRAALAEMAEEAAGRDVVVVSHVSPIKAAVAWALDVGDEVAWRMFLGPASITRVRVSGRGASLVSFNETAPLDRAGASGAVEPAAPGPSRATPR